jgi:transposase
MLWPLTIALIRHFVPPCKLKSATCAIALFAEADVRPTHLRDNKPVEKQGRASAVSSNPNSRQGRSTRSPLRQGWDKMDAYSKDRKIFVGIDVSKDRLDSHIHPTGEALAHSRDEDGLNQLVARLKDLDLAVIAIEATGGFESIAVAALALAGLPVVVVNPKQVHNYAKALGLNAKTDAIDACVIARFAEAVKPEIRPLPDAETIALADLLARRRQIVQMITAEKNRASRMGGNKTLSKSITRVIDALERELARLDHDIDTAVQASPVWCERQNLLASVPGIGKIIARTILAEMPELGTLDRRQAASLAGLAPWTRQSGQWRGKSMIGGGRGVCRTVLFLAALSAARHNPDLKVFSQRLLATGKSKKTVLIAISRKLLTILNAIIRDNVKWTTKIA